MPATILTDADNGAHVEARPTDEIVVRLRENPTTGFRWQIDRVDGPLSLAEDSFELDTDPGIGTGGVREFRFRANASGHGGLAFKHWQSWEGNASVTARFTVEISLADG